ncbi:hypothetical protein [Streptomyces sp. DH12]|uniref:hypothetical protein n=1 Tax=Streptomyces sp. DH12 TaxID=2857010 RepID=UPI001E47141A|nr:hypothetical protein [Streptomyces sp. DH12]
MIARRPVSLAVQTLLATATGLPVGRGRVPAGPTPGSQASPPYYVLYLLPTTLHGPPLADENADATFIYQVTSVSGPKPGVSGSSGSIDQVEWMADKARDAVLARDPGTGLWLRPLTVPGVKNTGRSLDIEPGESSAPDDAIITYVQRFRFDLTPA